MMKNVLSFLAIVCVVVSFSSCAALKANKCERCPEFTQKNTTIETAQIDCSIE